MKLILGRECNSKKIQEWRSKTCATLAVTPDLKGHTVLDGNLRTYLEFPAVQDWPHHFQQSVRNKWVYAGKAALTQSQRACLLPFCLKTMSKNASHFRFYANNSKHDKCWYLSTLILLLVQINIDKDYIKLGQGLLTQTGTEGSQVSLRINIPFSSSKTLKIREREKSGFFTWQLFQQ